MGTNSFWKMNHWIVRTVLCKKATGSHSPYKISKYWISVFLPIFLFTPSLNPLLSPLGPKLWIWDHMYLQVNGQPSSVLLLLLLLSCFSRVWLCATPQMAAHQALPSLGFSRQEHWSGLPFPSPMHESEKWKWSCSVVSNSSQPHGLQPTRLLHPRDYLFSFLISAPAFS